MMESLHRQSRLGRLKGLHPSPQLLAAHGLAFTPQTGDFGAHALADGMADHASEKLGAPLPHSSLGPYGLKLRPKASNLDRAFASADWYGRQRRRRGRDVQSWRAI